MSGQREQYRVHQGRPFLRATLRTPAGRSLSGEVVDLTGSGVGLRLSGTGVPDLAEGASVELTFDALILLEPIRAPARVRRWVRDADGSVRCGLQFVDLDTLHEQVPFVLRREFNRRSAPRVDVDELIEVVLCTAHGTGVLRGQLRDISRTGAKVQLDAPVQGVAPSLETMVEFSLPDSGPLALPAVVRSCDESTLHLQLIGMDDPGRADALAAIDAFVEQRIGEKGTARNHREG